MTRWMSYAPQLLLLGIALLVAAAVSIRLVKPRGRARALTIALAAVAVAALALGSALRWYFPERVRREVEQRALVDLAAGHQTNGAPPTQAIAKATPLPGLYAVSVSPGTGRYQQCFHAAAETWCTRPGETAALAKIVRDFELGSNADQLSNRDLLELLATAMDVTPSEVEPPSVHRHEGGGVTARFHHEVRQISLLAPRKTRLVEVTMTSADETRVHLGAEKPAER